MLARAQKAHRENEKASESGGRERKRKRERGREGGTEREEGRERARARDVGFSLASVCTFADFHACALACNYFPTHMYAGIHESHPLPTKHSPIYSCVNSHMHACSCIRIRAGTASKRGDKGGPSPSPNCHDASAAKASYIPGTIES